MTTNTLLIGGLAITVAVLGYLYYQETRNSITLTIDPPKVQIK